MQREAGRRRAVALRHSSGRAAPSQLRPLTPAGSVEPGESFQLLLLGPFGLRHQSRALRALPKKAQALLAYLAMQRGRPVPREQLADLLWGRGDAEQARRSLRQCLMSVRAALKAGGDNALVADAASVSLAVGTHIDVDVAAFDRQIASANPSELELAATLYRDEFLSGLQISSEPIAEWLLTQRRRLASAMSDLLYRLASAHAEARNTEKAIAAAERLTLLDPLREDAHRLLMQLLATAGRRTAALKQHALCTEVLRRDLGIAPEPATTELAEAIRKGVALVEPSRGSHTNATVRISKVQPQNGTNNDTPVLASPDKPSIALLPFSNLSGDPDQDYLANGITDDLAIALGRIPWLFVIATTSTATYRGHAVDVQQVGSVLGVRYLLRGSARRSNRRLRVVVQLTDATHGRQIWSDRYDGEIDDVFAIQDRVTSHVSASLAPALQSAEIERVRYKPTESLSAYDLYLRAVPRFRVSLEENREAISMLHKATQLDPDYGAAYALAARCYQFQKLLGWVPPSDPELAEGIRLGHLAADIGLNDSEALWMSGGALAQLSGEVDRGVALTDRSLVLNPNSANAWLTSSNAHVYLGDSKTAIEHFDRGRRLNPLDSTHHVGWNMLGLAHLSAGDFEAAESAADKALNVAPKYVPGLRIKLIACGLLGRSSEGRDAVKRLLAINPNESIQWMKAFWGAPMHRNPRLLENMVEGARRAGLPEGKLSHVRHPNRVG
jgi:TolB-like protein/DNA-binding SARP family transcriptional activator